MNDPNISRDLLRSIYDKLHDTKEENYTDNREDFAFHIVECVDDMSNLLALLGQRSTLKQAATQQVIGFLYHVVPHLNAASMLLLGEVLDTFELSRGKKPVSESE